eukprot:jgi/Botrbrau1/1282/Bobra.0163s0064.1
MGVDLGLHSVVQRQLEYLLQNSSCTFQPTASACGNTFVLEIPFCWQSLRWQVLFQRFGRVWVPDFLFLGSEDFSPLARDTELHVQALRSRLDNWDDQDETQLHQLSSYLLSRYTAYQKKKMEAIAAGGGRLQFEMETLMGKDDNPSFHMIVEDIGDSLTKAVFSVPIEGVDLSPLQPFLARLWATPGGFPESALTALADGICLGASYIVARGSPDADAPDLAFHVPAQLLDIIGMPDLPVWTTEMCMMEYLPRCTDAINSHVADAAKRAILRQSLLSCLTDTDLSWPYELDARTCRSASFQLRHEGVDFHVHVSIPKEFPDHQPLLILERAERFLRDSYHLPLVCMEPRWPATEMAHRILAFLQEEVQKDTPSYEAWPQTPEASKRQAQGVEDTGAPGQAHSRIGGSTKAASPRPASPLQATRSSWGTGSDGGGSSPVGPSPPSSGKPSREGPHEKFQDASLLRKIQRGPWRLGISARPR